MTGIRYLTQRKIQIRKELRELALCEELRELREAYIASERRTRRHHYGVPASSISKQAKVIEFANKYNRQPVSVGRVVANIWEGKA